MDCKVVPSIEELYALNTQNIITVISKLAENKDNTELLAKLVFEIAYDELFESKIIYTILKNILEQGKLELCICVLRKKFTFDVALFIKDIYTDLIDKCLELNRIDLAPQLLSIISDCDFSFWSELAITVIKSNNMKFYNTLRCSSSYDAYAKYKIRRLDFDKDLSNQLDKETVIELRDIGHMTEMQVTQYSIWRRFSDLITCSSLSLIRNAIESGLDEEGLDKLHQLHPISSEDEWHIIITAVNNNNTMACDYFLRQGWTYDFKNTLLCLYDLKTIYLSTVEYLVKKGARVDLLFLDNCISAIRTDILSYLLKLDTKNIALIDLYSAGLETNDIYLFKLLVNAGCIVSPHITERCLLNLNYKAMNKNLIEYIFALVDCKLSTLTNRYVVSFEDLTAATKGVQTRIKSKASITETLNTYLIQDITKNIITYY